MTRRSAGLLLAVVILAVPTTLVARQNLVANGSMEAGPGQGGLNDFVAANWDETAGNVERSSEANRTVDGSWALKAFGDGENTLVGGSQEVAAAPGQSISASVWLYTRTGDKLTGSGQAGLRIEFLNIFDGIISTQEDLPFDETAVADTWTEVPLGPIAAPSGTAKVRVSCLLEYTPGNVEGAVYWDDVELTGATDPLLNGDFETAGVSTDPNPFGIDEWGGFNDQQKAEDTGFHGTASVQVGTNDPYSGLYQRMGVLQAGDHVQLSARVMTPSSDPLTAGAKAGIKLEFYAESEVPPSEENLAFDETATPDTWTEVTYQTTVPADMNIAKIVCIFDPVVADSTTGSVYFDTVSATLNSGGNQLANESFETNLNPEFDWEAFFTSGDSSASKACFVSGIIPDEGNCMLKTTGTAVAGAVQRIAVAPGDTLDISAWLYTPSTDQLTGPGVAGVKVEWEPGNIPDNIDIDGPANTIYASSAHDVWHEVTIDYTMPAGSQAVGQFTCLVAKADSLSGVAYFDIAETVVFNRFTGGADSDGDDDADLFDFRALQECLAGHGNVPVGWPCFVFDADDDGDVDLNDYDFFEQGMEGPLP